jgi:hypothetical protein
MEAQIALVFDENLGRVVDNAFNLIGYFSHDTQTDDSFCTAKTIIRLIPNAIHPDFETLGGTNWSSITLVLGAGNPSVCLSKMSVKANSISINK